MYCSSILFQYHFSFPHLAEVPELILAPRKVKRFFTKQLTLGCVFKTSKEISKLIDDTGIINALRSENETFEGDYAKGMLQGFLV